MFSLHKALSWDRTNLLIWLMWRSNGSASNSASESARWEWKHTKCLQKHLVIKPWYKRQPMNGFSVSRMDGRQLMMSIVNDIQPEPQLKMWQKCTRLSWKTRNKWFTMFATLSDCCMECASEFCQMSSTRGAMQQNMCQDWWAVSKGIMHCCLHWAENSPNFISIIITGDESGVFGYNSGIKQQTSRWKTPTSPWPKKAQVSSNVKSMLIWFLTLRTSSIRNLIHQERRWLE